MLKQEDISALNNGMYQDHDLLLLLKAGDQVGIRLIYDKYWKPLYLSAYSVLRDTDQAQDIVQEVLFQLWVRRDQVKIDNLSAYLHMATRYKVLTYIRSVHNRKVFLSDEEMEQLGGSEDLNDHIHENDINNLLKKEVLALPERCRQVFQLSRMESFTNKEIAEQLGITVKAVESQITIALRKLRARFGDLIVWLTLFLLIL